MRSHLPTDTHIQALGSASILAVPAQVKPEDAAQSFCPALAIP
jgi:hypothetical protein